MAELVEVRLTPEEVQRVTDQLTNDFFLNITATLSRNPELKLFQYYGRSIGLPNGGKYFLSIAHLEGLPLDLEQLTLVAESQTGQNAKSPEPSTEENKAPSSSRKPRRAKKVEDAT